VIAPCNQHEQSIIDFTPCAEHFALFLPTPFIDRHGQSHRVIFYKLEQEKKQDNRFLKDC
jgi:hypothetical protein